MNWARWERPERCAGGAQPGAQAMLRWCLDQSPVAWSGGIYNCRTVRGGKTRSVHAEGRAIDVMLPTPSNAAHQDGYRIVQLIGAKGRTLGVQCVIFNRTIWSARSPGGRPYTGAHPHVDHVHIELTRKAARTLTYDRLSRTLGNKRTQPPAEKKQRLLRLRRPRMRGADVRIVQAALGGLKVDGIYGPNTERAVRKFQRDNGLIVDGIVGPITLANLRIGVR